MLFSNLDLLPELQLNLQNSNLVNTYPIQEYSIPKILSGKDVLAIAKTGSGKTLAYVLPILQLLQSGGTAKNRHVDALVLVPTRELALQVNDVFQQFSSGLATRVKSLAVYGGTSINPQMIAIQNTKVLIATPGRLLELTEQRAVNLSAVSILVLDEADKMLNLGFAEEMDRLLKMLPKKRQNLLFSATLSKDLEALRRVVLNSPEVISIESEQESIDLIEQTGYYVADEKKGPLLRYLIKNNDWKQLLIFTSSVYKADNVADKLNKNGISATAIHSKKSQQFRINTLEKFKLQEIPILVTTDLLARGIDIDSLPVVINYELPRSPKDYIHRIGRTGRAESKGEAISFVTPDDEHHFKIIQKKMKKVVTMINAEHLDLK